MWPVERLARELPDPFELLEDEDFVILRCRRCEWTARFSAAGITLEEILRAAREHRCPRCGRHGQPVAHGDGRTRARLCAELR